MTVTDQQPADSPEMRRDDPDLEQRPEGDVVDDTNDTTPEDYAEDRSSEDSEPDDTAAPEADDAAPDDRPTTGGRPPLIVMILSGLVLMAIGAGLAVALVPGRSTPPTPTQQAAAPTGAAPAGSAGPADPAAGLATPSVPTALPLPEAIGDVNSTEPVAQVGDTTITRGEFVRAYQPGAPPSEVLNQLIQVELVVQQAKAEGVAVDQARVDEQVDQIKQANAEGDDAKFLEFLQQNNIPSEEQLRELLARDQVVEQMLLTHTTMEQAHARHILLSATAEQIEARKAEAEDLVEQLEGGADFAQLASEKSEDPGSKDSGGDLGWAARGMFVPEFDEAIFSMEKGEVRLVQSEFGWHIIELLDLPAVRGLENRDALNTPQGQQAFTETFLPWVEKLKADAEAAQKVKILVTDDQLVTQPGA
jgi:peptidyl-prolyl cis-trans isomerase C